MPTSSLSAWSFANRGPLTTVFTAPASCFTVASQIRPASITINPDTNSSSLVPYLAFCSVTQSFSKISEDCIPSAQQIASDYATIDKSNPLAGLIIDYYSPGIYCPSGYRTVGVGANDAGTITSSGDGFVPTTTYDIGAPIFNPVPNVLLQGLNRGETAVLCCPNSFQVDPYGGACSSPLPSHPLPTEVCYRSLPEEDVISITTPVSIFGTVFTDGVLQEIASIPLSETVTGTITNTDDFVVVSAVPMITLVHNAAEATAYANPSATSTSKSGASSRAKISNTKILLLSCWAIGITTGFLSPIAYL